MSYLPDDAAARRQRARHSTYPSDYVVDPPTEPLTRRATRSAPYFRSYRVGRFFGVTALSFVLPGAGLLLSGRRRMGGLLLGVFVTAIAALAAFVYWQGPAAAALYFAVRPRWLVGINVGLAIFVVLWCLSIIHTGIVNRPIRAGRRRRLSMVTWVVFLCLALLLPTARAAQYAYIQRDLLQSVFTASSRRPDAKSPDLTGSDPWSELPRVNVLLIGSDAYPDRPGLRTDSMMVVSIDTHTGDAVLFGIPRNLQGYSFRTTNPLHKYYPTGPRCGLECMLNSVVEMGAAHAAEFPGDPSPGITSLSEVISDLLGLQIDNTVVIDIRGFSSLVDAMGGVDINVRNRLPIGGKVANGAVVPGSILGWIEPGNQHMNGYTAMWFARSRALSDDFDRMRRQRCMVGALVRQVNPLGMVNQYPALAKVAKDNIKVDIAGNQLPAWADLVTRVQKAHSIRSLPFTMNNIDITRPNYDKIHAMVNDALANTKPTATPTPTLTPTSTPTKTKTRTATRQPQLPGLPSPSTSTAPPSDGVVNVTDAC